MSYLNFEPARSDVHIWSPAPGSLQSGYHKIRGSVKKNECWRKVLYGRIRKELGRVFHELARQRESKIHEGHLHGDHVHMYISIPPKYAVAQVIGFIEGKSAIHIARTFGGRERSFTGENFWARGYFASTVGRDEKVIGEYIRRQEAEDKRLDQMKLLE